MQGNLAAHGIDPTRPRRLVGLIARVVTLFGGVLVFIGFLGWGLSDLAFAGIGSIATEEVESILALRGFYTLLTGVGFLVAFVGIALQSKG